MPFSDEPTDNSHIADQVSDRRHRQRREGWRRWRMMQVAFFLLVLANCGAFYWISQVADDNHQDSTNQTQALARESASRAKALAGEARQRAADLKAESDERAYEQCLRGNDLRDLTADGIINAVKAALGPPIVGLDAERAAARQAVIDRVQKQVQQIRDGKRDCKTDPTAGSGGEGG